MVTVAFAAAAVFGFTNGAAAQTADPCPVSPSTCVLADAPTAQPQSPTPVAAPTGVAAAPIPRQTLPVTGSETAALALGGTLLVAAGGALVWRSNKAAA